MRAGLDIFIAAGFTQLPKHLIFIVYCLVHHYLRINQAGQKIAVSFVSSQDVYKSRPVLEIQDDAEHK